MTRIYLLLLALAALLLVPAARPASAAAPQAFLSVTNTNDDGVGSLREAIIQANFDGDPDTIMFNIQGAGPHTIELQTALPPITGPTTIDALTQPGSDCTTLPATLRVELDGNGLSGDGLRATGSNVTIMGLVIGGFDGDGIDLEGSESRVGCNYIGVRPDGITANSNTGHGVAISGGNGNAVGFTEGTTFPNLLSSNLTGVYIDESLGNVVSSNYIGVNAEGEVAGLGNLAVGVLVVGGSENVVGNEAAEQGNIIAGNGMDGVQLVGGSGNAVLGNRIWGNAGLGIDLDNDGVNPNDPLDVDAGTNNLQNHPTIASVDHAQQGGNTTLVAALSSTPTVTYRIDFYASDECDPTGHGEGEEFLGYTQATADAEGNLTAPIELAPQSANSFYTATATDGDGNTSEFGPCNGPSAPVAADDAYTTPLDTPLVVEEPGVLANDTDAENDHTIAQLVTQPTNGTVELAPDGSFTYTATPGFTGEATFTYRAADETGVSEPATVTITVEQGTTAVTVQTFSTGSAPALPWSGMILLALTGSVLAARAWRVRR